MTTFPELREALKAITCADFGIAEWYAFERESTKNSPAMLAHIDAQAAEIERLSLGVALWRALYRRAINEANGLTNYVEERPELRRAERNLTAIEADARAALEQTK